MNLEDANKILKCLEETTFDVELYSFGCSLDLARERQEDAIDIIKKEIEVLEHYKKKNEVGAGRLDSISVCPECGDTVISKMSGGYHCVNSDCDYGEIAF
jgi:hypothetical protein